MLHKFHVDLREFALPEGIRCIGKGCFFDKKGILSITFPQSLSRICTNAFGNCMGLTQITLPHDRITVDEDAFRGCSSLRTVILAGHAYSLSGICYAPDTPYLIRRINDQVMRDFYISGRILMSYAGSEERVTVPDGVEIIGEGCFAGNDRIRRVILGDSVREIRQDAFSGCVCLQSAVLPDKLHTIGKGAFEHCRRLIRFNVPAALQTVGFAAFRGCRALETEGFETGTPAAEPIPARTYHAQDIAPYSRAGDGSVTELVFDKPAVIGRYAFSGCRNLRRVTVSNPDCVIEPYAFEKCPALREISVTAGAVGQGAFSFCRSLTRAEISGVTALGDEAFAGCTALESLSCDAALSEIGRRCFDECSALPAFDFTNIRIIGERAFERCSALTEITLTQQTVCRRAFADCDGLNTISLRTDTVLQSGAFFGCTCAETVILDGTAYAFSAFAQSRNTADNPLPLRVQEVIGSIYSCFAVSRQSGITAYRGDAVRVRIPDDIVSAEDEAFRDRLRTAEIRFPAGFAHSGKLTFAGTGWLEQQRKVSPYNVVNGLLIDAASCGARAVISKEISRICSWAFAGNTALTELVLLHDRVAVDAFAFRNCINLKTVRMPDGSCYTLESYCDIAQKDYPETVRRIFADCLNCFKLRADGVLEESTGNIRALTFPRGITGIGEGVYMDCNLLEHLTLAPETAVIGKCACKNSRWLQTVSQAAGVREIGAQAFSGCKSLAAIDLSDALESLGKRAFEHCCALREIHLSERLTEIPERAFFRCKSLRRVVIPASVRVIGAQAFAFCTTLEEVIFADRSSVQIADDAFAWCDRL